MLKLMVASAATAIGISLAGAASAEPAAVDPPRHAVVEYADLNLANAAGVEVLKQRIDVAARQVCGPDPDIRQIADAQRYEQCVAHAQKLATREIADTNARTTLARSR